ncbi:MAG TPA: DUF2069 domain-containing protein [Rhodocyclaceae bacterium]|nr:DUF2069 domain-containing protein [Rhodocyclaceae bacterium]
MKHASALRALNLTTSISLIALIILCLAWELWLAPLRPGGSMLALKALPLLAPLFGILRGRRYTHQWAALLVLLYLAEGLVRATSDSGAMRVAAVAETLLALVFFLAAIFYARLSLRQTQRAGVAGFTPAD